MERTLVPIEDVPQQANHVAKRDTHADWLKVNVLDQIPPGWAARLVFGSERECYLERAQLYGAARRYGKHVSIRQPNTTTLYVLGYNKTYG